MSAIWSFWSLDTLMVDTGNIKINLLFKKWIHIFMIQESRWSLRHMFVGEYIIRSRGCPRKTWHLVNQKKRHQKKTKIKWFFPSDWSVPRPRGSESSPLCARSVERVSPPCLAYHSTGLDIQRRALAAHIVPTNAGAGGTSRYTTWSCFKNFSY